MKFKPGALDAIFGPETTADLFNLADMVRGATVSERRFANVSRTGIATQNILEDIGSLFTNPKIVAGKIVGRMLSEKIGGRALGTRTGKRLLLGTTGFQAKHPGLIEILGRMGGQTATQAMTSDPSTRPRGF